MFNFFYSLGLFQYIKYFMEMNIKTYFLRTNLKIDFEEMLYFQ